MMERLRVRITVEKLPWNYTCDGDDISPMIEIGGVEATHLALMLLDTDASGGGGFAQWLMWDIEPVSIIPGSIPKQPEVTFPIAAVQGTNDFGEIGYNGPCPPEGQAHRYEIKVYGLDRPLGLSPGAGKEALLRAMEGHVVQYGDTFVIYGR